MKLVLIFLIFPASDKIQQFEIKVKTTTTTRLSSPKCDVWYIRMILAVMKNMVGKKIGSIEVSLRCYLEYRNYHWEADIATKIETIRGEPGRSPRETGEESILGKGRNSTNALSGVTRNL